MKISDCCKAHVYNGKCCECGQLSTGDNLLTSEDYRPAGYYELKEVRPFWNPELEPKKQSTHKTK